MRKVLLSGVVAVIFFATDIGLAQWSFQTPTLKRNKPYVNPNTLKETEKYAFVFARMRYSNCPGSYFALTGKGWQTDYPKADEQLLIVIKRILGVDAYNHNLAINIDHDLNQYPFLYVVESGQMCLGDYEVDILRNYFLRGGFMMVDDLWGTLEWESFAYQMSKVFPEYSIKELTINHPIFNQFFEIKKVVQIPNVSQAMSPEAPTFEGDGYVHRVYGIEDSDGRLMVLIFHNTDLGDAWEWAENPRFPLKMSNYAFEAVVNAIVYAMSH